MVMARPNPDLRTYLEAVSGGPVSALRRLSRVEERLPLLLRGRYRLESVRLFDHELVLATELPDLEPATPAVYAAQVATLAEASEAAVVLVLASITSTMRARLVAARVPFIVPGNQLFLPMLLVDLRERMTKPVLPPENALGSVAQLVVLAHLQGRRMDAISLADAASLLGYSPMMLTKAKDELVAAGLCTVRQAGRALRLGFEAEGRALWEAALPRLSSPILRSQFVRMPSMEERPSAPAGFMRAGISALSEVTNLAEDRLVTFAAGKLAVAAADLPLERVAFEDEASARLESWRYAPAVLATEGRVDPLSLYLSLRDTGDERLLGALDDLLETLRW